LKQVEVRFSCGKDVLSAYWGFLSDGGLVIPDRDDFDEGQAIKLSIHIASSDTSYALGGRVVRRHMAGQQAIVAFDPGEPHDMLLTAALSETDDVPARRFRRYPVSLPAEIERSGEELAGQLTDISRAGCCIRLAGEHTLAVGDRVHLSTPRFAASGAVVWIRGKECGVSFDEIGIAASSKFIDSL
jgi:hypothetical protein